MTNLNFKMARLALGLRQYQLAERVGLKERDISYIETGRRDPPADIRARLADVLGKPTWELFQNRGTK